MPSKSPKIALVYDRVNKLGGAERVLVALHELWPEAPLYTSVYDPEGAPWAKGWDIRPSFLNGMPFLRHRHHLLASLMPYAFESFDFSPFDIVISVTSAEAKGIITKPHQLHLCYLLTPTKYLWSHTADYQGRGLKKIMTLPFMSALRQWDYLAAQRPDQLVAISQTVASRCLKYYHRQVKSVIYPPVEVTKFVASQDNFSGKAYLIVSRLIPIKKIDLALAAFKNLPQEKLIIVGEGSDAKRLRQMAPPNVTFMGQLTDAELIKAYQGAKAFIFPQEEDFGITSVEAQAAGLPVIAFRAGGATETVVEGKTGLFFDKPIPSSLTKAILSSQHFTWYHQTIAQNARRFATPVFKRSFLNLVEALWHQPSPRR